MAEPEFGAYHLLFAGRVDEAIEKIRTMYPDGVVDPGACKRLQEILPHLPSNIDRDDARLDALIRDACAERGRQLSDIRRKLESGVYQIPEIVWALDKGEQQ
jgi:hypothetical protein